MSKLKIFNSIPAPFLPDSLITIINRYQKLLIYGVIGGGAVVIDMGLFWLINATTHINPIIINTVSIAFAMIYSFLMNAYFNFKATSGLLKRFASFGVVTLVGFLVSSIILWLLSIVISLDPVLIKALTLPIVFIVQFMLNSKFTFKQSKQEDVALESIT